MDPAARETPSGEKAIERISFLPISKVFNKVPFASVYILILPSADPEANISPFGDMAVAKMGFSSPHRAISFTLPAFATEIGPSVVGIGVPDRTGGNEVAVGLGVRVGVDSTKGVNDGTKRTFGVTEPQPERIIAIMPILQMYLTIFIMAFPLSRSSLT